MNLPFTKARRKRLTVLANDAGHPPEAARKELPVPDPALAAVFIAMARAASRSKPPEPYPATS